jgi:hypothetical protein
MSVELMPSELLERVNALERVGYEVFFTSDERGLIVNIRKKNFVDESRVKLRIHYTKSNL